MNREYTTMISNKIMSIKEFCEDDVEKIKIHWLSLQNGKDMTVFQTYDWNTLLLNEFKKGKKLKKVFFLIVFENKEPIMIAPMYKQRFSCAVMPKGIYLLGNDSYSDYINLIYKVFREDAFRLIVEYIKRNNPNYKIVFNYLRKDTDLYDYLHSTKSEFEYTDEIAVFINLECELEEYKSRLSKNVRQNLRTAMNRIHRAGITYELVEKGKIRSDTLCKQLIRMHAKRLTYVKLRDASGIKRLFTMLKCHVEERRERRHCIAADSMRFMDNSWLCIFYYNNEIAGYLYGLKDRNGIIRVMHNCFNSKYEYYSPNFRGLYDVITKCIESKDISQLDLTRGDEKYKYMLGGEESELVRFEL